MSIELHPCEQDCAVDEEHAAPLDPPPVLVGVGVLLGLGQEVVQALGLLPTAGLVSLQDI